MVMYVKAAAAAQKYLQILYTDEMDICSTEEKEAEDGTTNNVYPDTPQQVNIPCRISLSSKDLPSKVTGVQVARVELNPVIFCSKDVKIRKGDRITVRRKDGGGTVFETYANLIAEAGFPNKWISHQEVSVRIEGDA